MEIIKSEILNGFIINTYDNGTVEKYIAPHYEEHETELIELEPEPTQLDRIEAAVNKSQQEIIDEYTLELMEGGII